MDAFTLRVAVLVLGTVAVLCVGGIVWLEGMGHATPCILATLASGSLGAVAGLLSQRQGDGPLTRLRK